MHAKELRGELANIGQKVDANAVLIKYLELQMAQLSTTVNPRQSNTLLSIPFKILKMMNIAWSLLLEEVSKLVIHICRLW